MGYEVDIIGIGQESKSGDAITLRWGDLYGPRDRQKVVIIDGGFRDSGQIVVDHIQKYYGTDSVDAVISTHPDQDHINGLEIVLDKLCVQELWIHKPWEHNHNLASKFADGRVTDKSIGERLRRNLESASDLVEKARKKRIPIAEPFSGLSLYGEGELLVLGPSLDYYESLIPEFEGMPSVKSTHGRLLSELMRSAKGAIKIFSSIWGRDDLNDEDTTSAKNNSSVVIQLIIEGYKLLFTGDAGVTALSQAADRMSQEPGLRFIQIPHHGSRRNVGPTVLNRLIGKPLPQGQLRNIIAIASTAKEGEPKHPRKAVMNAFTHRGVSAVWLLGELQSQRYQHDAPVREGLGDGKSRTVSLGI